MKSEAVSCLAANEHLHMQLQHLRCLCQKLLAVVEGQIIEILCKRCKRLIRIKIEKIIELENATLTK